MLVIIIQIVVLFIIAEAFGIEREDWPWVFLVLTVSFLALLPTWRFFSSWIRSRRREQDWINEEIGKAKLLCELEENDL